MLLTATNEQSAASSVPSGAAERRAIAIPRSSNESHELPPASNRLSGIIASLAAVHGCSGATTANRGGCSELRAAAVSGPRTQA